MSSATTDWHDHKEGVNGCEVIALPAPGTVLTETVIYSVRTGRDEEIIVLSLCNTEPHYRLETLNSDRLWNERYLELTAAMRSIDEELA